jgi:hypothetical protein
MGPFRSYCFSKYENMGKKVELTRLNDESLKLITRVGLQKPTGH